MGVFCGAISGGPGRREKPRREGRCRPYPQTDTGGQVENTKAIERILVKELGKSLPCLRYKGDPGREEACPRSVGGGTDQGVATVYQKHRCMRRRKPLYMH